MMAVTNVNILVYLIVHYVFKDNVLMMVILVMKVTILILKKQSVIIFVVMESYHYLMKIVIMEHFLIFKMINVKIVKLYVLNLVKFVI